MALAMGFPQRRANKAKHGVSFALAVLVFNDPLAVTIPDPH